MKQEDSERLAKIETNVVEIKTHMEYVKKAIEGNGSPGLIQRVGSLENWRFYIIGIATGIAAIISWLL